MSLAEAVSVLIVLFLAGLVGVRMWLANRRAARLAAETQKNARERREKEKELLERLGKLKERDDLSAAASAIARDPERAARVVSRMMKDKSEK